MDLDGEGVPAGAAQYGAAVRFEGLFNAQQDHLLWLGHTDGKSRQSAIAKQSLAGSQIELPGMQRTNQRGSADKAISQRSSAMRTFGLHCINLAGPRMKHRYVLPAHAVNAAFAGRNIAERT